MSTKSSKALDAQVKSSNSRAQEQFQNDANRDSDADTRVRGSSKGWGDKAPKRVDRRRGN